MKTFSLVWFGFALLGVSHSFGAAGTPVFDAKTVAKLDTYLKECNGPGQDPKPKMAEFVKHLEQRGLKDVKIECTVSHYGAMTPMLNVHVTDGAVFYVNYKKKGAGFTVSEIIEDALTSAGTKRRVVWPLGKK